MTRPSSPLMLALIFATLLALSPALAAEWDPRLDGLNVTLRPAADCSTGCWRLISAQYEDEHESQGLHHIWSIVQDERGNQLAGAPWTVAWEGGRAALVTKPFPEWADFPMYASYAPDRGESGPYRAFAGNDEARSDVVAGMGLPLRHHVNFRLIWQWTREEPPPELPFHWWLPVAASGD